MANVTDLINYYANLLIVQYHDKAKAQATIKLLARTLLANGILSDIENAFNIDTAVGKQLDIIGKYVGVDRFYSSLNLTDYFSLVPYDDIPGSLPTSPPRFGFSTYATYDDFSYNGTLNYDDIITRSNSLYDDDYRKVIKLKIQQNYSNASIKQIDEALFDLFAGAIRVESAGNMSLQYFIDSAVGTLAQAIIAKKLLPAPMAVAVSVVSGYTDLLFALTDYTGYVTPFGYGFSTYSDYDTLPGEVLTYDQITEV